MLTSATALSSSPISAADSVDVLLSATLPQAQMLIGILHPGVPTKGLFPHLLLEIDVFADEREIDIDAVEGTDLHLTQ